MGSLFKTPKTKMESGLSNEQQALLGPLAQWITPQIGQTPQGFDQLQQALLGANTQQSQQLAERMFKEAYLPPVLQSFDQQIAPRINSQFGGIGGTLSSRRTDTLARTLGDVTSQATSQFAGILPQIMSFPLQQTLSQIQGLGDLQRQQFTPFQNALQFALQPTRQATQQAAGPGWGLLGSGLQLAGIGLGGGFGGGRAASQPSQPFSFPPVTQPVFNSPYAAWR